MSSWHTNDQGWVTKENFDICFEEIARDNMERDPVRFKLVLAKLFKLFDRNGDGRIDFSEITTALTVLCRGGRDEKAAAFALWDANGDGTITLDEMTSYLECVFALMYEANPIEETHASKCGGACGSYSSSGVQGRRSEQ